MDKTQCQKPTHCATHKSSDMKNNKAKQCLHNGCDKQPSFGLENGKPLYCSQHKMVDMTNKTINMS